MLRGRAFGDTAIGDRLDQVLPLPKPTLRRFHGLKSVAIRWHPKGCSAAASRRDVIG